MNLRGRWRIVETPDYDMGTPAYIVFRKTGGEFALGCLTGAITVPARAMLSSSPGKAMMR